jgi:hypothetical protein
MRASPTLDSVAGPKTTVTEEVLVQGPGDGGAGHHDDHGGGSLGRQRSAAKPRTSSYFIHSSSYFYTYKVHTEEVRHTGIRTRRFGGGTHGDTLARQLPARQLPTGTASEHTFVL